jgi:hypothetical protein
MRLFTGDRRAILEAVYLKKWTIARTMAHYIIKKVSVAPSSFDDTLWLRAGIATIDRFRPESSDHRPAATVRMLHDGAVLYGFFSVQDRYVVSRCVETNGPVCEDSCVEFFVKPDTGNGYFNFEFNAGGTVHASYITDRARTADGFKAFAFLDPPALKQVTVIHSLPSIIDPETTAPTEWKLTFSIPAGIMTPHAGDFGSLAGKKWTGNFFKCGDRTSHPHWASWSPVSALNFHLPECFGDLVLE